MVEMRWVTPPGTTTKAPTLQWRNRKADPWGGLTMWDDWRDVPTVVVPTKREPWTAKEKGRLAGDGAACPNDHDPDCRWPQCMCREPWPRHEPPNV